MDNIQIQYDKNSKIYDFDSSLTKNLFFENEILENKDKYKLTKQKRYLLNVDLISYNRIYIYNMNISTTENGFLIDAFDTKTLLIPIGEHLYLLAFTDARKEKLYSIIYTFLNETKNYIDVTLYKSLFRKNLKPINLYKKK